MNDREIYETFSGHLIKYSVIIVYVFFFAIRRSKIQFESLILFEKVIQIEFPSMEKPNK